MEARSGLAWPFFSCQHYCLQCHSAGAVRPTGCPGVDRPNGPNPGLPGGGRGWRRGSYRPDLRASQPPVSGYSSNSQPLAAQDCGCHTFLTGCHSLRVPALRGPHKVTSRGSSCRDGPVPARGLPGLPGQWWVAEDWDEEGKHVGDKRSGESAGQAWVLPQGGRAENGQSQLD